MEAALSVGLVRRDRDAAVAARNALEADLPNCVGKSPPRPDADDLDALRRQLTELEAKRIQTAQEARDLRAHIDSMPDVSEIERARDAALAARARLAQMLEGLRAQLSVAPATTEWRQPLMLSPRDRRAQNRPTKN